MSTDKPRLPSIKRFKQQAKELKKRLNISHAEALDELSKRYGFNDWLECNQHLKDGVGSEIVYSQASFGFQNVAEQKISGGVADCRIQEVAAEFKINTSTPVAANKRTLARLGIEFSVFQPTITGLKKSIIDATHSVRIHFEQEGYHRYSDQGQGPENKVVTDAFLLTAENKIKSSASLYRPNTKQGDPRMWFRNLGKIANENDWIAIVIQSGIPYLINLSKVDLALEYSTGNGAVAEFIRALSSLRGSVADELLGKLKTIAKSRFKAQRSGDTAIGYTLETLLGIQANSSKSPDYKGIEIKSGRGNKNRNTLFAQVADWKISPCKRSADILYKYGYQREEDFKLYCTVSTKVENSQGLSFKYDQDRDELQEWYRGRDLVAIWPGALLRKRLIEKHSETFWVEARSEKENGEEFFTLTSVKHTRSPLVSQLLPLIESGVVTMDHLIKKCGKTGRVSEKGPLFKIDNSNLELLFPEPKFYSLQD